MHFRARAPGKLVVLGEYAVLDGAPALVVAVDRYCRAEIRTAAAGPDGQGAVPAGRLTICMPEAQGYEIGNDGQSGVAIVDLATDCWGPAGAGELWSGSLDSRDFFSGRQKIGLGSSAAALCAWAGVHVAGTRAHGADKAATTADLPTLIGLHRRLQGGSGSGLDVATSLTGGAVRFSLDQGAVPQIGSVRLPNSVGFAGVFTGASASTPDFIARYRAWQSQSPREAGDWLQRARSIAGAGCVSAQDGDALGFLESVAEYGRELENLGTRLMREVVTEAHSEIGRLAARRGVVYKVSGAGGGDLGIVMSCDREALNALRADVDSRGFEWLDLRLDEQGLTVEEVGP